MPANLALLDSLLSAQGYRVRCFPRGAMALAAAAAEPPDLILLDINMPELDGYEVCARLKADPRLAPVPVIFLSAFNETVNKLKGFQCGGVDYITKPFQAEELLARVRTHLELRHLQAQLREQNARLDELVRLRTGQLAEALERLSILDRAKTDFLRLISHELRTPLNGLLGVGEMLLEACPPDPTNEALKDLFQTSRDRLLTTIDDALLLAQIEVEAGRFKAGGVPLDRLLRDAVGRVTDFARSRNVWLGALPEAPQLVHGDLDLCVKALQALLETAVRFSAADASVGFAVNAPGPEVVLGFEARGFDIPPAVLPRFFEVLAIPEAIVPGGDLGLAAPLAQRLLGLFGARVDVQNLTPPGVRLEVRFAGADAGSPRQERSRADWQTSHGSR